jgi:hypothetical protein
VSEGSDRLAAGDGATSRAEGGGQPKPDMEEAGGGETSLTQRWRRRATWRPCGGVVRSDDRVMGGHALG